MDPLPEIQISVYRLEVQIPIYMGKEGRKEEDNSWRLLITHTGFYVCVSSDLLIHVQILHILCFFFFFLESFVCI